MARDGLITTARIGVVMGGVSAEREVSLNSGRAMLDALVGRGYDAVGIDAGADLPARLKEENVGVVLIALHGGWGENGGVQGLLEVMGIPYTGSGVLASALAMDKIVSKILFQSAGIPVPEQVIYREKDWRYGTVERPGFQLPWVVKPAEEGSSIGVSIVHDEARFSGAVEEALKYDQKILVEEFIAGREIQIAVLAGQAIGRIEVRPKKEFYDYECKYTPGMTEYILNIEGMDETVLKRADEMAVRAYEALGCKTYSRVDFRIDAGGTPYILEVNTLPGMTATSLFPKIAARVGIPFPNLLEKIIGEAIG